ncbi:MAG: hypothetical protein U0804_26105 [Gemmataceae bacterium]
MKLRPVVEAPWFEGAPPWPWPIADRPPFSFVPLSGDMTDAEVGTVMAQLMKDNDVPAGPTAADWLAGVVAADHLILSGGIQASDGDREINPGCCCGLEGRREWTTGLASGAQPWTGHDPAPRVEWAGDAARIWSDGAITAAPDAFAVECERSRFAAELWHVERDLTAFVGRVTRWARSHGVADALPLRRRLESAFSIEPPQ